MARAHCFGYVQDRAGNAVRNASVHVYDPGTTDHIAETMFEDDTGVTTVANPLTTDANGRFAFYLDEEQRVDLKADAITGRIDAITWEDVDVLLPINDLAAIPLPNYTTAELPAAGTAGRLARVTDGKRGVYIDDGTRWQHFNGDLRPEDFGAIGDGTTHPLSERYATLAEAQAVYPHAVALTDEIDWAALQLMFGEGSGYRCVLSPQRHYLANRGFTLRAGLYIVAHNINAAGNPKIENTAPDGTNLFIDDPSAASRIVMVGVRVEDNRVGMTTGSTFKFTNRNNGLHIDHCLIAGGPEFALDLDGTSVAMDLVRITNSWLGRVKLRALSGQCTLSNIALSGIGSTSGILITGGSENATYVLEDIKAEPGNVPTMNLVDIESTVFASVEIDTLILKGGSTPTVNAMVRVAGTTPVVTARNLKMGVNATTASKFIEDLQTGQTVFGASRAVLLEWTNRGIRRMGGSADTRYDRASATDVAISARVVGDAVARFAQLADGKQELGDGTNARDTNLYRSAANKLKTDDAFIYANRADVASAAEITLPAAGNFFRVTGTTNISSILDSATDNGRIVVLQFLDVLTVVDGIGTLRLAGDFRTASTSTLVLISTGGGAWLEIARADNANNKWFVAGELEVDGALNHDGTTVGFYGTTPATKPTALTAADASVVNSGDATTDTVINNMRTRINELETKLQSLGLLS